MCLNLPYKLTERKEINEKPKEETKTERRRLKKLFKVSLM